MDRKFNEPMLSFSLPKVALRKESVDRKDVAMSGAEEFMRRSPQGERG